MFSEFYFHWQVPEIMIDISNIHMWIYRTSTTLTDMWSWASASWFCRVFTRSLLAERTLWRTSFWARTNPGCRIPVSLRLYNPVAEYLELDDEYRLSVLFDVFLDNSNHSFSTPTVRVNSADILTVKISFPPESDSMWTYFKKKISFYSSSASVRFFYNFIQRPTAAPKLESPYEQLLLDF